MVDKSFPMHNKYTKWGCTVCVCVCVRVPEVLGCSCLICLRTALSCCLRFFSFLFRVYPVYWPCTIIIHNTHSVGTPHTQSVHISLHTIIQECGYISHSLCIEYVLQWNKSGYVYNYKLFSTHAHTYINTHTTYSHPHSNTLTPSPEWSPVSPRGTGPVRPEWNSEDDHEISLHLPPVSPQSHLDHTHTHTLFHGQTL